MFGVDHPLGERHAVSLADRATVVPVGVLSFRPLTRDDFGQLAGWLARPHVQRWWNHEFTPEAVERDFGASIDGDDATTMLVVVLDERPIGLLQHYLIGDYPEYVDELRPVVEVPEGAASIDYFIGEPDVVGIGIGRQMVRAGAERAMAAGASCVIVPVNSANVASWTALRRAGFHLAARADLEPDNPIDGTSHEILRLDR